MYPQHVVFKRYPLACRLLSEWNVLRVIITIALADSPASKLVN